MEEIEVSHIKKNIEKLIELTTCNVSVIASLEAQGVLSKADTQLIDRKNKNEGDLAAARLFYEIMMIKKDSYILLVNACEKACLSGALSILQEIPTSNAQNSMETEKEQSKKDLKSITVGTRGCDVHINQILEIAARKPESDTTLVMLQKEWKTIGMFLNIPLSDRDAWSTQIVLGLKNVLDIFAALLTQWSSSQGEKATLEKLMDALKNSNMNAFSGELEKAFAS